LARGRYVARVEVTSSGQKCVGLFHLINDVARRDFRLELASLDNRGPFAEAAPTLDGLSELIAYVRPFGMQTEASGVATVEITGSTAAPGVARVGMGES